VFDGVIRNAAGIQVVEQIDVKTGVSLESSQKKARIASVLLEV
jgi:hypothetical protein